MAAISSSIPALCLSSSAVASSNIRFLSIVSFPLKKNRLSDMDQDRKRRSYLERDRPHPGAATLLLLEELKNASIVALSVLAVYDATKAFAVLR
jgi:hypothetical protein